MVNGIMLNPSPILDLVPPTLVGGDMTSDTGASRLYTQ